MHAEAFAPSGDAPEAPVAWSERGEREADEKDFSGESHGWLSLGCGLPPDSSHFTKSLSRQKIFAPTWDVGRPASRQRQHVVLEIE